jgi:hypothetical protein
VSYFVRRKTEILVLDEIDRHALFHEMHRAIEESATVTVNQLAAGEPLLTYPPNHGLSPEEIAALDSIPKTPAMKSALRKIIADAAAYPLFHLLSLADGVAEPPLLDDVQEVEQSAVAIMLHDGFNESYWAWRRRRPDPGWRLDMYESE